MAGYSQQDADNYGEEWTRTRFGANGFIHEPDIKMQATYRINDSAAGVDGDDADAVFVQA